MTSKQKLAKAIKLLEGILEEGDQVHLESDLEEAISNLESMKEEME